MALPKRPKRSPAAGELPFEYDWEPAEEVLTAYAGIPLFVRAARSLDVPGCLQAVLRNEGKTKAKDLYDQIEEVITAGTLPSHLSRDLHAVRVIGNFAAHSTKGPQPPS